MKIICVISYEQGKLILPDEGRSFDSMVHLYEYATGGDQNDEQENPVKCELVARLKVPSPQFRDVSIVYDINYVYVRTV